MAHLPILCYHQVGSATTFGRRLNIEPEVLEKHVRFFARKGFRFAKAAQLNHPLPQRCVAFTFDDAFASAVESATAILRRNQAWGTFYAVPSLVGGVSSWEGGDHRPLATWDALRHAQAEGMEIGNHTNTHPHLDRLVLELQLAEMQRAEDAFLQHGIASDSICYPYGGWNQETLQAAKAVGMKVGMALGKRPARDTDPLLALPRIVLAYSDGLAGLLYKLHVRPRLPRLKRKST